MGAEGIVTSVGFCQCNMNHEFKIGDKVRYTGKHSADHGVGGQYADLVGREGTVVQLKGHYNAGVYVKFPNCPSYDYPEGFGVYPDNLEFVNPLPSVPYIVALFSVDRHFRIV